MGTRLRVFPATRRRGTWAWSRRPRQEGAQANQVERGGGEGHDPVDAALGAPAHQLGAHAGAGGGQDVGVSHSTVQRIWQAHDLEPHRVETFKFSTDPEAAEKISAGAPGRAT